MPQRPSEPNDLQRWSAVDAYFEASLETRDKALDSVLTESRAAGLPEIQVSPLQGKILHLLARICAARRILEIGTLGGYSTVWLARALPSDGRVVTLEKDPKHAAVAAENFRRAGVGALVDLRLGPALVTLAELSKDRVEPFDLVFIDAEKSEYTEYLEWSLRLTKPGALIIADNVVRRGDAADPDSTDSQVRGIRRMIDRISNEVRLSASVLQTVGRKGYDGMLVATVQTAGRTRRNPTD